MFLNGHQQLLLRHALTFSLQAWQEEKQGLGFMNLQGGATVKKYEKMNNRQKPKVFVWIEQIKRLHLVLWLLLDLSDCSRKCFRKSVERVWLANRMFFLLNKVKPTQGTLGNLRSKTPKATDWSGTVLDLQSLLVTLVRREQHQGNNRPWA